MEDMEKPLGLGESLVPNFPLSPVAAQRLLKLMNARGAIRVHRSAALREPCYCHPRIDAARVPLLLRRSVTAAPAAVSRGSIPSPTAAC